MKLSPDIIERVLADKHYWRQFAAQMMAESQRTPRGESDSAMFEIGSLPLPPLEKIVENRLLPQTRVRLTSGLPPMISEVKTIDPDRGVIVSQRKALRLKRKWNESRLRSQRQVQARERGDAAGEEEEEEGANPMQDHPGKSCGDAHGGMSHDDFLDQQEEEEERQHSNPLYRQNSAGARSISPSRRTRERER